MTGPVIIGNATSLVAFSTDVLALKEPMVALTATQRLALEAVGAYGADLRKISESYRQCIIDLAMMEPPLVDVEADHVFLTAAGRAAIDRAPEPKQEAMSL